MHPDGSCRGRVVFPSPSVHGATHDRPLPADFTPEGCPKSRHATVAVPDQMREGPSFLSFPVFRFTEERAEDGYWTVEEKSEVPRLTLKSDLSSSLPLSVLSTPHTPPKFGTTKRRSRGLRVHDPSHNCVNRNSVPDTTPETTPRPRPDKSPNSGTSESKWKVFYPDTSTRQSEQKH